MQHILYLLEFIIRVTKEIGDIKIYLRPRRAG